MPNVGPIDHKKGSAWIPETCAAPEHPHMTDDFARVYEMTANRIMGQIAAAALERVGTTGWGTHVLDVAAGAGALSVPAALRGAAVLAIDNAPGMVNLLSQRLAPFPASRARLMDGQSLALDDGAFDASFSIVGTSLFPDWRRGLAEQARVTRAGGKACIATWRKLPGGGPFIVMAQALRSVFPDMRPPAHPESFAALSDPDTVRTALGDAGLSDIEVEEIEVCWEGPAGPSYLDHLAGLHRYMGAYASLGDEDRHRVDDAILSIVQHIAIDDRVVLYAPVLVAIGTRT